MQWTPLTALAVTMCEPFGDQLKADIREKKHIVQNIYVILPHSAKESCTRRIDERTFNLLFDFPIRCSPYLENFIVGLEWQSSTASTHFFDPNYATLPVMQGIYPQGPK